MYYDFHAKPITYEEWSQLFSNTDARRVGMNWVGSSQYWISTVWLGTDHGFGQGRPLIYETMVFHGDDDIYIDRYSTWDEAEAGHIKALVWTLKKSNDSYVKD